MSGEVTDDPARGRFAPDVPAALLAAVPEDKREEARSAWLRLEPGRREVLAEASPEFAAEMLLLLAHGWDPLAPLNRLPDDAGGGWARKVRFSAPDSPDSTAEWMWVRVESPEATTGELLNDATLAVGAAAGSRVAFRITPAGHAEAVRWVTKL